jgi:hypothetical protein
MPTKQIDLPPGVVLAFVRDMRAFHIEANAIKRDEIAARQCFALRAFQRPRDKKIGLADIKDIFLEMKDG